MLPHATEMYGVRYVVDLLRGPEPVEAARCREALCQLASDIFGDRCATVQHVIFFAIRDVPSADVSPHGQHVLTLQKAMYTITVTAAADASSATDTLPAAKTMHADALTRAVIFSSLALPSAPGGHVWVGSPVPSSPLCLLQLSTASSAFGYGFSLAEGGAGTGALSVDFHDALLSAPDVMARLASSPAIDAFLRVDALTALVAWLGCLRKIEGTHSFSSV
jgi:hypothetical protein